MYPIALDLKRIPVLLAGKGELLERRRKQLEEAGAEKLTILDADNSPSPLVGEGRGEGVSFKRDPRPLTPAHKGRGDIIDDIQAAVIVLVTGLTRAESERIANLARAAGKLVNVEDQNDLCDFYFTANVRRGDLIIAVSTSGASPTLARKVRDWIAEKFGVEWGERVTELATLRRKLKDEGKGMQEVLAASEEHIAKKRWLA